MFDVKGLVDISKDLGLLDTLKAKLIRQPDPAAAKLQAVLDEIAKLCLVFEQELVRYLSLTLDPAELNHEKAVFIELESGQIAARMGAARGHCSKISNIFGRYLDPWFQRLFKDSELSNDELLSIDRLFRNLSDGDSRMLDIIDQVSGWLAQEAAATSDLIEKKDLVGAQARLAQARKEVLPARRAVSEAMRNIYEIQATFVAAAGPV
jgi:hypothetical protein